MTSSAIDAATTISTWAAPASSSDRTAWLIKGRPAIGSVKGQAGPAMSRRSSPVRAHASTSPRKSPTTYKRVLRENLSLPVDAGRRAQILELELGLLAEFAQHPGAVDRIAAGRFGAPALGQ